MIKNGVGLRLCAFLVEMHIYRIYMWTKTTKNLKIFTKKVLKFVLKYGIILVQENLTLYHDERVNPTLVVHWRASQLKEAHF